MRNNTPRRQGFTLVELLVVITIIAALAGIATPMILNARKASARTDAMNNARQLGMAMLLFADEYGRFPDQQTAQNVVNDTGTNLNLNGNTSNDFLRQLLAGGYLDTEDVFFAQTQNAIKPDNVIQPGQALQQGECGFAYVMQQNAQAQSPYGNAARPLLMTPVLSVGWDFDPDPFDEKAVVLRLDNSVDVPRIRQTDNQVPVGNGNTLGSIGPQTVWGTNTQPIIMLPQ